MLRQFIAIFLLFAFAAQVFNRNVIMLNYYTNTAAFAKNCVNKVRPMMHCNGKCQMMKKLKEEEKKEQQNPERRGENKNEVVSARSFFPVIIIPVITIKQNFVQPFQASISQGSCTDIFHPPALV